MKQNDPFRNSELDRAKPKRHIFHSLLGDRFKRHRSDTGLVEDRTSSVTIVRIIVGLLMIHLIIIGGVLLRGQMVKENSGLPAPASITPPPAPLAPAAPTTQPTAPVAAQPAAPAADALPMPVAAPAAPAKAQPSVAHITQASASEEDVAEEVEAEPVIITPPAAAAEPIRHLVAPGDSWLRIAAQYGTTEAALKAANPQLAQGMLKAGSTLTIPVAQPAAAPAPARQAAPAPAPAPARQAAPAQAQRTAAAPKVYTVKRGENLSVIARKVKIPMKELMQINGLKDANRIQPGMQLRLSR